MSESSAKNIVDSNHFHSNETAFERINIHVLVPGKKTPVNIFIYNSGKYEICFEKNSLVSIQQIANFKKNSQQFFFIQESEKKNFQEWTMHRHSTDFQEIIMLDEKNIERQKKITQYLKFAFSSVRVRDESFAGDAWRSAAEMRMRHIVNHKLIEWFFELNIEQKLTEHSARLTFLLCLFLEKYSDLTNDIERFHICLSSICHELEGDTTAFFKDSTYDSSINKIKNLNVSLPQNCLEIIANQNEFFNGKGFPKQLQGEKIPFTSRIFNFFNTYDHFYKNLPGGDKNFNIEKTKQFIKETISNYDETVIEYFFLFHKEVSF